MQQRLTAMDAHQASMQRQLNQVRGIPLPAQPSYANVTAERNPELLRVQLDSALERNEQLEADISALRRENTELPVLTGSLCSGGCNDWRRSARANPLFLTVLLLRMINLLLYIMIRHGLSWTPVLSKILQTALPCVSMVLSLMHRLKFCLIPVHRARSVRRTLPNEPASSRSYSGLLGCDDAVSR